MINILFVLPQLSAGGSERVVLELARHLDTSSFNVTVAYFNEGILIDSFKEAGADLFHIPKKEGFDPECMWRIAKIIQRREISIINAHHYMPFFYSFMGAKVLGRKSLVFTEHSVPEVEAVGSSAHRYICKMLLRQTDRVVGVSKEVTRAFTRLYPAYPRLFDTVINGVDLERFTFGGNHSGERARLGIAASDIVVGVVANFRNVKNHACLVRAAGRLKARHPEVKLVFVGTGNGEDRENSEDEIYRLIQEHGLHERVIFTGYQEEINRYLTIFDIFCLPSLSEGLPLSILEAMSSGVPVVSSNVNGVREIVVDGENGLLFPSNNDEALARTIEELIAHPEQRDALKIKGRAYVQKYHDLNSWIKRYEAMFNTLVRG